MPRAARNFLMFDVFSKIFYLNLMILGSENSAFPKKRASLIYEFLYPTAPARVQICTRDLAGRSVWVRIRTHLGKNKNTGLGHSCSTGTWYKAKQQQGKCLTSRKTKQQPCCRSFGLFSAVTRSGFTTHSPKRTLV